MLSASSSRLLLLTPHAFCPPRSATGYDSDTAEAILICGPGDIAQAHMADEWVEVEQLVKFKGVLAKWLGVDDRL